jgi:hypothetical protein
VVEGEAQSIVPEQKTSKVVVKILHEDATTTDQMYFLHEVKPYRELDHPNILKLLGRCLETDPFLVLLEACPSVSSFLSFPMYFIAFFIVKQLKLSEFIFPHFDQLYCEILKPVLVHTLETPV